MSLVPKTTEMVHRPKVRGRGAGSIALRSAGCALPKKTSDLTIHLGNMAPTLVPDAGVTWRYSFFQVTWSGEKIEA